jgi:hypothetical protein
MVAIQVLNLWIFIFRSENTKGSAKNPTKFPILKSFKVRYSEMELWDKSRAWAAFVFNLVFLRQKMSILINFWWNWDETFKKLKEFDG